MTALMDATVEQVAAVSAITETLVAVERTISSLQAARDGLLALGARIASETARDADDAHGEGLDGRGHDVGEMALRAVAAEFATALRVSDRTVQRRMTEADLLVTHFPALWRAQGDGRISAGQSRVLIDAGMHLDDADDRDAYAAEMIEWARTESPGRLVRRARRVAERLHHRSIDERHQTARERRAVWVKERADGMAELGLLGPAALVHGAFDRITAMAQSLTDQQASAKLAEQQEPEQQTPERQAAEWQARERQAASNSRPTDQAPSSSRPTGRPTSNSCPTDQAPSNSYPRTLSQIRCDLALDLFLTGAPTGHDSADGILAAITGSVSVTVPVQTLMGASTMPAELDGRVPIDVATARRLAGGASGWDRVLTHPISGRLLAVDRYRPSAELKRHLRARDQRCRFPGCGQLPRDCDIDHTRDHALGGSTDADNLGNLCRRHHSLKHHTPWHVEHLGDGLYTWTSPTGRTYFDAPPEQNTDTSINENGPPGSIPPF